MQKNINTFYKNNNLVLQTNFSLPWTPRGFGNVSDAFHIKSKIGLMGYLGINKINEKKVTFGNFYFWDNEEKKYLLENSIIKDFDEILNFLKDYLNKNNFDYGIEINFLSEVPRGHGFGFSGVFSSLLSAEIFLVLKKLNNKELFEYENFLKSEKFNKISKLSYKLEGILRNNKTNGLNSLSSFLNFKNPVLYYSDNSKLKYEKIVGDDFSFVVDFYVIFSGIKTDTNKVEKLLNKSSKEINIISSFIGKKIEKLNLKSHYLEKFGDKEFLNKNFENLFHFLNLKQINNFEIFGSEIYDDNNIKDFIKNIGEYRKLYNISGEYSDFLNIFEKSFYKNKKSLNNNIGIMPIYGGKIGGGYLVVSKENTNRKVIKKTVEDIQNYYPSSYIEYCNYEDNKKIEGIKLIQDIENNIFHKSLIGDNFRLKTKNKIIIVENIEEAIQKDFDLIFDTVKGKVYLKGKKITSKEIHSQYILTEIISKLFEKQGEWISNKFFNKSSYSETKSVMGGRVVYPLRKLILKKLGKEIIFDIKGIGGDFEMKLDFGKLKVGILEKIYNKKS